MRWVSCSGRRQSTHSETSSQLLKGIEKCVFTSVSFERSGAELTVHLFLFLGAFRVVCSLDHLEACGVNNLCSDFKSVTQKTTS